MVPNFSTSKSMTLLNNRVIEHGTSKKLIERVRTCLEASEFKLKPKSDARKWKKKSMSVYYACMGDCDACMRLVYNSHIMIIDYLFVNTVSQSSGMGRDLVKFAKSLRKDRILFCLATEESCGFWMKQGFISNDDNELNIYDDTYLLTCMH